MCLPYKPTMDSILFFLCRRARESFYQRYNSEQNAPIRVGLGVVGSKKRDNI